jgi:hypothetical protein
LRLGHLIDQEALMDIARAVVGSHFLDQPVEFFLIFVSENSEGAGQAVLGRVPAGRGFAVGSTGAGTQCGVLLVCDDLRGGRHVFLVWSRKTDSLAAANLLNPVFHVAPRRAAFVLFRFHCGMRGPNFRVSTGAVPASNTNNMSGLWRFWKRAYYRAE